MTERPSKNQLVAMLKTMTQNEICRRLKVCHKTVKKWRVFYGITEPPTVHIKRPTKKILRYHLKKRTQKEIAEFFKVTEQQVKSWKDHYNMTHIPSAHTLPITQRKNPIVECQCGCGTKFPKWKFSRGPTGRLRKHERRFVNGHASSWNAEQRRVELAIHWANKLANFNVGLGATYTPHPKLNLDFSEEYIAEAWLALAEGVSPQDRILKAQADEAAFKRMTTNIETVMRHPDICEQVACDDPDPTD